MGAINSNTVDWLKDGVVSLLGNKGGLENGLKKAATKMSRTSELETIKAAREAGKHGKQVKESIKDTRQVVANNIGTAKPKNLVEGIGATAGITKLVNKGEDLTENSIKAAAKSSTSKIKRDGIKNAVKDYYAEPFKKAGSDPMAAKQFVARVGATATAGALGVGVTHDLLSNKESDSGIGGIATNTMAVGGLATAGAFGASLLKKL